MTIKPIIGKNGIKRLIATIDPTKLNIKKTNKGIKNINKNKQPICI